MELTVLGKYGPYPKGENGACSGYIIKNEDDLLVLDLGSGALGRLLDEVDIREVKNIFISHLHFDHTSDLLPLRYLLEDLNLKVNIYTKYEDSEWYDLLLSHPNFNVINVDEGDTVKVGSMTLSFIRVKHIESSLAVVIEGDKKLCYTGDTAYCGGVEKCFEAGDIILADCSKPSGFKALHMTVDEAKRFAEKYPEKLIIATHQSTDYDPEEDLKEYKNILALKNKARILL